MRGVATEKAFSGEPCNQLFIFPTKRIENESGTILPLLRLPAGGGEGGGVNRAAISRISFDLLSKVSGLGARHPLYGLQHGEPSWTVFLNDSQCAIALRAEWPPSYCG